MVSARTDNCFVDGPLREAAWRPAATARSRLRSRPADSAGGSSEDENRAKPRKFTRNRVAGRLLALRHAGTGMRGHLRRFPYFFPGFFRSLGVSPARNGFSFSPACVAGTIRERLRSAGPWWHR